MNTNTYTEEEFKKLLKTLFAEKKRVKELQKQIEDKHVQKKFQAKLSDIHKRSLSEEYPKLKEAFEEKELEAEMYRGQLEKVKPALKKLVDDLKQARGEIERLKSESPLADTLELNRLHQLNEEAKETIRSLEEEKTKWFQKEEELIRIEDALETERNERGRIEKILEGKEEEVLRLQANEQKEIERFEGERTRLVERLADCLSQIQRQTETLKELQDELNKGHREKESVEKERQCYFEQTEESKRALLELTEEYKALKEKWMLADEELGQLRSVLGRQAQELEEREVELTLIKDQLQRSDLASIREEYELKMQEALSVKETEISQLVAVTLELQKSEEAARMALIEQEAGAESVLEKMYAEMRELSIRHALMVEELEKQKLLLEEKTNRQTKMEKEISSLQSGLQNTKLLCDEREAEIRKAQQHLAKKVKETTILRDLAERQKVQLQDLHGVLNKQKSEIENMQNHLNLQKIHEEKLQTMAKERSQVAEAQSKEWQEKYLALQKDWQEIKAQMIDLQKIRKSYDQMTTTFSSLKHLLGKSDLPEQESEDGMHV